MTNHTSTAAHTAPYASGCEHHHLRNVVGLALSLLTVLLWNLPSSPTIQTLAICASVATGYWWAFGQRLMQPRSRHDVRLPVGLALSLVTALLWSLPTSPVVFALALTSSVVTGWWWAFGLRDGHSHHRH